MQDSFANSSNDGDDVDSDSIPSRDPSPSDHVARSPADSAEAQAINPYETFPPETAGQQFAQASDPLAADPLAGDVPLALNRSPRPRIWTALALPPISLVTFFTASGVMIVVAFFAVHGEVSRRLLSSPNAMESVSASRLGLFLLVVVPQIALVLPSVIAAILSPVDTAKRLSLVRGNWPYWAWIAAAVATPLVGLLTSLVIGGLVEESENLKMMSEIFRAHGKSGFLIPLALLIGATPAICEELLFRGYVQTRLSESAGPVIGIVLSAFLFAAFHIDWVHVVAVFPLGVYLGFIAWRSKSIFPAMLAHFVNNAVSVVSVVLGPEDQSMDFSEDMRALMAGVVCIGIVGVIGTIFAIWRYPMNASVEQAR